MRRENARVRLRQSCHRRKAVATRMAGLEKDKPPVNGECSLARQAPTRPGAGVAFLVWIARNPLKSPELDEGIQENPSPFSWSGLVWLGGIWPKPTVSAGRALDPNGRSLSPHTERPAAGSDCEPQNLRRRAVRGTRRPAASLEDEASRENPRGCGTSRLEAGPRSRRQRPARYWVGSTGVEPLRSSKWSCGALTLPVSPDLAMIWPRLTVSPRLTSSSPLLA